jgi:hypothetical protein
VSTDTLVVAENNVVHWKEHQRSFAIFAYYGGFRIIRRCFPIFIITITILTRDSKTKEETEKEETEKEEAEKEETEK